MQGHLVSLGAQTGFTLTSTRALRMFASMVRAYLIPDGIWVAI